MKYVLKSLISEIEINKRQNSIISNIKTQHNYLKKEVENYNSNLFQKCSNMFKNRKNKILKENDFLNSLSVPIKKKGDLKETYAIPLPKNKRKIISKPVASKKSYKPEPTLDESTYKEILKTIFDVGKVFERNPSTYTEKEEEDLRDHFLLYLEPRFEGSTTGETFNKSGKTDILIRYKNSNVFIAECKFWSGQKNYLKTISQLLSYLTWRDSKAAVIIFVRNKNFSSVISTVENVTSEHSNFKRFNNKQNESWFNYTFHINGDEQRDVKLAVLLFHIPS